MTRTEGWSHAQKNQRLKALKSNVSRHITAQWAENRITRESRLSIARKSYAVGKGDDPVDKGDIARVTPPA